MFVRLTTDNAAQEKSRGWGIPKLSPTPEALPFHREHAQYNFVAPGGNICTMNTAPDTSNSSMKGFEQTPTQKKLTRPPCPSGPGAEEMSQKAEGCKGG